MEYIVVKLNELADLKAAAEVTQADYEAKRAEILKVIQAEIDALDAEYRPLIDAANMRIGALETEVREDVAKFGASVKGHKLHAVYSHGRVSWDTKALDVYALSHPEVVNFRKQGEPSVSIRTIK